MTSQRLRIRSEARREIDEAFDWYFARSPEIARAFLDEIENSLRQVAAHAQRFPLYTANTRRRVLDRFPYSVIYSEKKHVLLVVAVAHAKRRPGYWAKRN
jgi:plasmid stabilization system protein ParE